MTWPFMLKSTHEAAMRELKAKAARDIEPLVTAPLDRPCHRHPNCDCIVECGAAREGFIPFTGFDPLDGHEPEIDLAENNPVRPSRAGKRGGGK